MKITLARIRKPAVKDINADLQWFGTSLGLFGDRDREKSCFRIFVALIRATRMRRPLSSDEIAAHTHLSRGTVVHHLHKLQEAGLVVSTQGGYLLRVDSLSELVDELRIDASRLLDDLGKVAVDLDEQLGLMRSKSRRVVE